MMNYRERLRFILLALLSALLAACAPYQAERVPTEAPYYAQTAPPAPSLSTPLIGQLGAVDDPSATPISAAQRSPSPEQPIAQLGTPAFTVTFGAVVDSSPQPPTRTPSPPTATEVRSTLPFGAVVDPNYTPPPTYTPLPSPTLLERHAACACHAAFCRWHDLARRPDGRANPHFPR
jgi:hypothetical protein